MLQLNINRNAYMGRPLVRLPLLTLVTLKGDVKFLKKK